MVKASESCIALGQRLKQVRQLNGLSQRELGRQAGVTNSNISMIEQGLISPSITSLERLLAVFPMSLEQFFTWNQKTAGGEVFRAQNLEALEESSFGLRIQTLPPHGSTSAGDKPRYLERCLLDPGSDTGAGCIKTPYSLLGWLLEGEVELSIGPRVFSLGENDGFYVPAQQLYRLRNLTDSKAVIMLTRELPQNGA